VLTRHFGAIGYPLAQQGGYHFDEGTRTRMTTGSDEQAAGQQEQARTRSALREIVQTLLTAVIIFVLIRSVVLTYRVEGTSMVPALHPGQLLLVGRHAYLHVDINGILDALPFVERDGERIVYPFGMPSRGDIVIVDAHDVSGKPYVKRVVGLPGDRVAIHDGAVYVNGERLDEPYIHGIATTRPGRYLRAGNEQVIPDGYVFVMGDNRSNSRDSRDFGPVPISAIKGQVWLSLWPPGTL